MTSTGQVTRNPIIGSEPRTDIFGWIGIHPDRLLKWNADMLAYETEVMSHVPHHLVCYETGLKDTDRHQATINDICRHLGVVSGPVSATMKRIGGERGRKRQGDPVG